MRPPARLLFLVTTSAGGAGTHAYQLARGIDRERFDLTVALGSGYPLDADLRALGEPFELLCMRRNPSPWYNLRCVWQVARLLRRRRVEVLCTSCSIAGLVGRLAAVLARTPVRVHVVQVYASRPHQPAARRVLLRWIERALDRLTTRYVAVSEAFLRYGVESRIFAPEKACVIHNAAELPPPAAGARERLRAELGIAPDAPVVGTLGRFEPQKGLDTLLRAAARTLSTAPATRFVVVGDGPLRGDLESLARELGIRDAVHFLGWRSDVSDVLSMMDLFCLASRWEAFGIVLAEAMLAGLPVVATQVDGIPEVVEDGVTGRLVPADDERAIAARLAELVADGAKRRALGAAGRARAAERFSVERMVAAYERLFEELVAATRATGPRA